jgi:large subunit ribosomal protein L4
MKINVINLRNEKVNEMTLPEDVFGLEANSSLITQYLRVMRNHLSQGTASAKTRSEVSGGGKKPWRQKGTGRARHGSRRSPIWVHGGVAHGPKPDPYLMMPTAMRRKTFKILLSVRMRENNLFVVNDFSDLEKPSTKKIVSFLDTINVKNRTLFVSEQPQKVLIASVNNLPKVSASFLGELSAYDILKSYGVIFEKAALENLISKLGTSSGVKTTLPPTEKSTQKKTVTVTTEKSSKKKSEAKTTKKAVKEGIKS